MAIISMPEPDQRIQMRGRQPDAGAEMLRSRLVVVQALADRAEVVGQRGIVRGTLDRLLEKAPGFGMAPKVTLVALTTFFPIAVSLLEGRPAGQAYTLRWPRTRRPGSAACPR